MTTKAKLNKAFRELRKKGYTAKQNFLCCQNCAWHALSDKEAEKAVFYHRQDADAWYGKELDSDLYLAWSGDADEICEVLKAQGLEVVHEGGSGKRIAVKATIKAQ